VPTFVGRGCHVVNMTDPYSRIIEIPDSTLTEKLDTCSQINVERLLKISTCLNLALIMDIQKSYNADKEGKFLVYFNCIEYLVTITGG
jgi:hypothetical protein